MGARKWFLPLALALLPAAASADRHKAGFGAAGAYLTGRSTLGGMSLSGDVPIGGHAHREKGAGFATLSAVGEITLAYGEHAGETLAQSTYLVGLRASLNRVGDSRRFQPFVQALAGGAHVRADEGRGAGALALGIGADALLFGREHERLGLRFQYQQHWLFEDPTDSYGQISVGVILRLDRE